MSQAIERDSPVPYYEQLFEILRSRIVKGAILQDERLPSESELCREYGLSRATVRQTLSKLETDGYARRVARRGVFAFVQEKPSGWTIQDEHGFLESQLRHGRTGIETTVVDARFLIPPQHVSEALQIDLHDEVFALERVRSVEGSVAIFSTNWFPSNVGRTISATPDVLNGTGSVNNALREAGHITSGARRVIRALRASDHVATHLGIDQDQPVLQVRSLSWDHNDERFDYYETWVLTEIIPLEVNVSAN